MLKEGVCSLQTSSLVVMLKKAEGVVTSVESGITKTVKFG